MLFNGQHRVQATLEHVKRLRAEIDKLRATLNNGTLSVSKDQVLTKIKEIEEAIFESSWWGVIFYDLGRASKVDVIVIVSILTNTD